MGLVLHVETLLGGDGKLLALQERIRALLYVELLRNQTLMLLGVELPRNEAFQIRIHLRSRIALLLSGAIEHVFTIAHTILRSLVFPTEGGRIFKIHRASLVFRVSHRAWVGRIAVSR